MVLDYRKPNHSDHLRSLFGAINGSHGGIDLYGVVEIKESRHDSPNPMFTVDPGYNPEYWLFYHHISNEYNLVRNESIDNKMNGKKRGFRLTQIRKMSIFNSTDNTEIKSKIDKIVSQYFEKLA